MPADRRLHRPKVRFLLPWVMLSLAILAAGLAPRLAGATPAIQTWTTSNGARVLFVAAPEIPMLDLRISFNAGSARDGDSPGLASLTAAMLDEGADAWNTDAVADRLDRVGASLSAGVDRDMTVISLRTLTQAEALETAIATLEAVVARPSFPPESLERVRKNRLVALRQEEESPSAIAQRALYRAVFGRHPYAEDPAGTPTSIGALSREALAAFHGRYYVAANAVLALVGDLDRPRAQALAERVARALAPGEAAAPLPDVPDLALGSRASVGFPVSQTTVLAAQPGMRRGDPDYFPLYVGNHILGGSGLVSLLMKEIRERHGLAYSTYSYFLPLAKPGPFLLGLQTRNDQAEQARDLMLDRLRRFIAEGPSEEELRAAKRHITGSFPLKTASNASIVQYLTVIGFYGLPLDYLERFNARVQAVTAEQIRDAFARRIHPARLAVVSVGGSNESKRQADGPR